MVSFRAMREDEFGDYLSYFIRDNTAEIAENFHISLEAAEELARAELARDLPDGVNTTSQFLLCIIEDLNDVPNDNPNDSNNGAPEKHLSTFGTIAQQKVKAFLFVTFTYSRHIRIRALANWHLPI